MPTYDYQCPDCGHQFEVFQTMTAKVVRKCPNCGKRRVKRLIGSGLAPIFKGSGFYETDYKPKTEASEPRPQGSGTSEQAAETPKAPAQTETKPEAKPTRKPASEPAKKPAKK